MNDKIIQRILGAILILAAIYTRDFSHWIGTAIFFTLFLSGAGSILKSNESEFSQKLGTVCRRTAFVISIVTLVRLIFQI